MQKIAILYDASQAVLSTFDFDEVLQRILVIARDYFRRETRRSAFKPVVAVLFLSILDVNPPQFLEINLLIVSPTIAKDERA